MMERRGRCCHEKIALWYCRVIDFVLPLVFAAAFKGDHPYRNVLSRGAVDPLDRPAFKAPAFKGQGVEKAYACFDGDRLFFAVSLL